ncbi:Fic/DOC family protein [Geopseudomonas sagittaria]|uniref:Fic/DOC family protein n=1 Tax=Geopseudomonas sagittaria TaxID=1135990 RepID=A0A1I5TN46_9GAMM|nr:Fic family protein [Pseudomonas sagittaria]MCM2330948.1 Fic family protein [Pseudomonas sagittaria]SFP84037.1 Fic/DOC family protein [Pseudomonas sagittaria]
MQPVGYSRLLQEPAVRALPPVRLAETRTVTRKEVIGQTLAIPASMAPAADDLLGHVLFALKHEGIDLAILAQVLPLIPEPVIRAAIDASPTSQYLRKVCYLWEHFTGQHIQRHSDSLRTTYVPLFDPAQYITAAGEKNSRWRVLFNGIGNLDYCITLRRTDELQALLDRNLLQQATEFSESLPRDILNRALAWAYLHETRDSYAIERESPSEDKASRFVNLLKQAHQPRPLDEDYLVELQNAVISNVYALAAAFRHEQNYLSNGLRGALGVTYVPPPPELGRELMVQLMQLANQPPGDLDPLLLASIVSFGFVFIHPFMDGNGRLSRFLFHQVLCQRGALKHGLLLPVSVVLRQNESDYLATLQGFSEPARRFWEVTFIDEGQFAFDFTGHPALYRYWDGTTCAEFMLRATEQALERHLKEETLFLNRYDAIYRRIDQQFDIPNSVLSRLVMFCLDQNGKLSQNRRKQYQYQVPEAVFDALETAWREVLDQP